MSLGSLRHKTTETDTIDSFTGKYFYLSNFSEHSVHLQGLHFPTAEAAFQAMKTIWVVERIAIRDQPTPGKAKRLGNKRPPAGAPRTRGHDDRLFTTLQPNWEKVKVREMEIVVARKFNQHPELIKKLLATGNAKLIEGNNWRDDFWGCIKRNGKWHGRNELGKILMKLRENYK